jgi:hypothetical protein
MSVEVNRKFVEAFEHMAYSGHLSILWRLGETDEQADALHTALMEPEEFTEDIRSSAPLDEWFFAANDWKPTPKQISCYNRIMALTELGKLLGATEGN